MTLPQRTLKLGLGTPECPSIGNDVSMSTRQARCHLTPATGYLARGWSSDSEKDLVPGNVVIKDKSCDTPTPTPVSEAAVQWKTEAVSAQGFPGFFKSPPGGTQVRGSRKGAEQAAGTRFP